MQQHETHMYLQILRTTISGLSRIFRRGCLLL